MRRAEVPFCFGARTVSGLLCLHGSTGWMLDLLTPPIPLPQSPSPENREHSKTDGKLLTSVILPTAGAGTTVRTGTGRTPAVTRTAAPPGPASRAAAVAVDASTAARAVRAAATREAGAVTGVTVEAPHVSF